MHPINTNIKLKSVLGSFIGNNPYSHSHYNVGPITFSHTKNPEERHFGLANTWLSNMHGAEDSVTSDN